MKESASTHGLILVDAFSENITGQAGEKIALEFRPDPAQTLLVACLWSHWAKPGETDLLSFSIITDDPPLEISEACHDRCPVPIKQEHIDAWRKRGPRNLLTMDAILGDQPDLHYQHKLAS